MRKRIETTRKTGDGLIECKKIKPSDHTFISISYDYIIKSGPEEGKKGTCQLYPTFTYEWSLIQEGYVYEVKDPCELFPDGYE